MKKTDIFSKFINEKGEIPGTLLGACIYSVYHRSQNYRKKMKENEYKSYSNLNSMNRKMSLDATNDKLFSFANDFHLRNHEKRCPYVDFFLADSRFDIEEKLQECKDEGLDISRNTLVDEGYWVKGIPVKKFSTYAFPPFFAYDVPIVPGGKEKYRRLTDISNYKKEDNLLSMQTVKEIKDGLTSKNASHRLKVKKDEEFDKGDILLLYKEMTDLQDAKIKVMNLFKTGYKDLDSELFTLLVKDKIKRYGVVSGISYAQEISDMILDKKDPNYKDNYRKLLGTFTNKILPEYVNKSAIDERDLP